MKGYRIFAMTLKRSTMYNTERTAELRTLEKRI